MTNDNAIHLARRRTEAWHESWQSSDYTQGGILTNYPNTGKTYGMMKALAETDKDGALLQPNRALRAESLDSAEEIGLDARDMPSFPEDSPLMDERSDLHDPQVEDWYNRGASPRAIYELLGDDAPTADEDPYRRMIGEDLDGYDLLVGDPVHAHLERTTEGRNVALDDIDPYSSFVTEYDLNDEGLRNKLGEWARHRDEIPAESAAELIDPSPETAEAVLSILQENDYDPAADIAATDSVTVGALRVARAAAKPNRRPDWLERGNGDSPGTRVVAEQVDGHVIVARIPKALRNAEGVLMMSATPVMPVFDALFDELSLSKEVYNSMTPERREDYFDEVLGADVVQTTEASRFISGASNARPSKLRLTVEEIRDVHGEDPVVISSKKALEGPLADVVEDMGLDTLNFARAVGTNQFSGEDLAVIWGAPHYGDGYIRRVAAFCGDRDAEPIREGPDGERIETRWSTETSQAIYENMCEGTVFQAMLRVGREAEGRATIYVETDKIPQDVPRQAPKGHDLLRLFTEAEREVLGAMQELERFTARELFERVSVSRRTVYDVVERLGEDGIVEVDEAHGGNYGADVWAMAMECADRGMIPESVRDDLNDTVMEKSHALEYKPAIPTDRTGHRSSRGGVIPPEITPEGSGPSQLDLSAFGSDGAD